MKTRAPIMIYLILLFGFIVIQGVSATNIDFDDVHQWLYIKNMTQYENRADFRENDPITRGEAAKFIAQYAEILSLGKTYTQCEFIDIAGYDYTLVPFISEVCSYGLIKGSQGRYMPNQTLTEAQALTIVIRSLEGFKDETKSPWYSDYFASAQQLGLIQGETLQSVATTNVTRGKLGTWLFLAYVSNSSDTEIAEGDEKAPSIGISMNLTEKDGKKTDITGKVDVEIEQSKKITGYIEYDATSVQDAVTQGQQVVLFFRAGWCPLCQKLDKDLNENESNIPEDILIVGIDYDTSSELKRQWGVTSQHTLIYLDKNGEELYKNVKKELTLIDIITVITTQNGTKDDS